MGLLNVRELMPFPGGDNATDTIINGVHFNTTALEHWNYTLYSNDTISNHSRCYIIFKQYQPHFLGNGSWINATTCYVPINGIGTRGKVGIAFAALFTASVMFTLINLRKHGKMYLREDKRFRIIGRRWQWYWMLFVAGCAMISTITGIDIERNYLQSTAIILQSFFYSLMFPGTLAMVWEATRHWGSWQERQICDIDPYRLPQDDKRSKVEFYLPLVFYLLAWMNFFMTIPRSWTNIERQRSAWQQAHYAETSATDARFKAGSIIGVLAWFVILYSLHHSLHYYKPQATGLWNKFNNFCHHCPTKLFLINLILAIRLAYSIASAWIWRISLLKYDVDPVWPFALGYAPTLLIMIVLIIYGYIEENEDKQLIAKRRERGRSIDSELGIVKKPSWWRKMNGGNFMDPEARLRAMTTEVGGGRPTGRNIRTNVELGNMNIVRNRSRTRPSDNPFADPSPTENERRPAGARTESDAGSTMTGASAATGATGMTGNTLTETAQPQRIRSMLDI
ncbi:hypothetical protein H2201_003416 [Coniosporium apollinis]|uniref:Uncharacterized protein n=1 Tax=Coniosporium apollinis TaxID=61459 RepID=A0ABQ9NX07_9PEZI|nr:hypothetical protein H2201_003416 [Coniosporium apollinis]